MNEDAALLETYVGKACEQAFKTLVERHFNMVYATALRCLGGRSDLARDVCQQVFTLMAREAGRLQGHPALAGWLYRTAHNVACRVRRDEHRRQARELKALSMQNQEDSGESVDWEAIKPRLDEALAVLSEKERDALVLRFFSGRPYAQVAACLGVTEDAARMRVERGLGKLRTLLERRGVRSSAAALATLLAAQGMVAAPAGMAASVSQVSLAAAATLGPVGAGAAVITFMSTSKVTVAACLAGVVAVGTAVYEYQRASASAAATAEALHREQLALDASNTLGGKVAALEQKLREAEQKHASSASAPAPVESNGRGMSANDIMADRLFSNPDYVELAVRQYALQLRQRYAPFYRKMKFDAAKIAAFEALELEKYQSTVDMAAAARAKGLSLTDPSLKNIQFTDATEVEKKQLALIGEEGLSALKEYLRSLDSRRNVSELAAQLMYTSSTLSADQGERLVEILAANTTVTRTRSGISNRSTSTVDWDKVLGDAATVLSSEQLAAFSALVEKRRIDLRISQLQQGLMQEAMAAGGKGGS